MSRHYTYTRPTFAEALAAWKKLLRERGLPEDISWIFDENLCFEKDPEKPAGFRIAYQAAFTPPPPEAETVAYKYFAAFDAPIVFYRAGTSSAKSMCLLLCDPWFENPPRDEFIRRDEWLIQFRPGGAESIEEVSDEQRWKKRLLRNRPLHPLDFCMTLRGVHEILAHGRVLTSYEHYALNLLHVWRRIFGSQH